MAKKYFIIWPEVYGCLYERLSVLSRFSAWAKISCHSLSLSKDNQEFEMRDRLEKRALFFAVLLKTVEQRLQQSPFECPNPTEKMES